MHHRWFRERSDRIYYVMMEMRQETDYVTHHIQKMVGFFLAMRNFADRLREEGHQLIYLKINDPNNHQDLKKNLSQLVKDLGIARFEYQWPEEYRLDQQLKHLCSKMTIPTCPVDSEHFLSHRDELAAFFKGKKSYVMESFYRHMRKKHKVLMENGKPVTGKWNYDVENRKSLPEDHSLPEPLLFIRDVSSLVQEIEQAGITSIGNIDRVKFTWPVTREEQLELLDHFLNSILVHFGTYQDAMTQKSWTLFHSRLSFGLNLKLIHPMEVIRAVETHWNQHREEIHIAQAEGFIRQILGWREYMRGIYWAKMPRYEGLNFFNHSRKLPEWFWNGKTKMNCLQQTIQQSLDHAYAHHIQRLMVTGNFGLLAGIHPDDMDSWYLGIYIDAIQWVEITNTRGMSQYADGGIVGTKPYVSSANYIRKMSDYCRNCSYQPDVKTGEGACPFNSLYWHFYDRNREKLSSNPRISMMYKTWGRMNPQTRRELITQANHYLDHIEDL
jgi:deoxyribodipyrimidine photolyase-related protein